MALDLSNELANWNAQNTVLARVFSEERLRTFSQLYSVSSHVVMVSAVYGDANTNALTCAFLPSV